jgi:subtilisin
MIGTAAVSVNATTASFATMGKPSGGGGTTTPTWTKASLTPMLPWWNDVIDVDQQAYTGAGTVVVIIDTGMVSSYLNYFPAENILTTYCKSYTKDLGKDRVAWNKDTEGHGTAVTGTIIGYRLDTSTTDYWVKGVSEDAKIVMIRCLYWIGGSGKTYVSESEMLTNWANAIDYARSLKAGALSSYKMIISMSLGYTSTNTALTNAISNAEAAGIVVCASAGNEGPSPNTTGYPASLDKVTSVAAAGYEGLTGTYGLAGIGTNIPENDFSGVFVSEFSSRGKVDVTGIGENLILPYYGGYYYISGTSFSCPQTSGVFALMFQAHGSQTVAWLESKLKSSAVNLGYDSLTQGSGFIQADGATA